MYLLHPFDDEVSRTPIAATAAPMPAPPSTRASKAQINSAYASVAEQLWRNGYSPIPLTAKEPIITKWQDQFCETRPAFEQLDYWARAYRAGRRFDGVGVACHGGLVIIDIDAINWTPIYLRLLAIMPSLANAPAVIGQRGLKLFVRTAPDVDSRQWHAKFNWNASFKGADGKTELEVLAWHKQGAVPPTIHPKLQQPYRWRDEAVTLLTVPHADLPTLTQAQRDALAEPYSAQTVAPKKSKTQVKRDHIEQAKATKAEKHIETTKRWDGDKTEAQRIVAILKKLSAEPGDQWRLVGEALISYFGPTLATRKLWDDWSRTCPEKFNKTTTQDQQWQAAVDRVARGEGARIGTLFALAKKAGIDVSLNDWPTLRRKLVQDGAANGNDRPDGDTSFEVACRALLSGGRFHESLRAQLAVAMDDDALTPGDVKVLFHLQARVNPRMGYAWMTTKDLAERCKTSERQVGKSLLRLSRAGYLVEGPFKRNPQSVPATSITLRTPTGASWDQLLEDYNATLGHVAADDEVAAPTGANVAVLREREVLPPIHTTLNEVSINSGKCRGVWGGAECDAGEVVPECPDAEAVYVAAESATRSVVSSLSLRSADEWFASSVFPEGVDIYCGQNRSLKYGIALVEVLNFARERGVEDHQLGAIIAKAVRSITWDRETQTERPLTSYPRFRGIQRIHDTLVIALSELGHEHTSLATVRKSREQARARQGSASHSSSVDLRDQAAEGISAEQLANSYWRAASGFAEPPEASRRNVSLYVKC